MASIDLGSEILFAISPGIGLNAVGDFFSSTEVDVGKLGSSVLSALTDFGIAKPNDMNNKRKIV
jgi:hypothetical protein